MKVKSTVLLLAVSLACLCAEARGDCGADIAALLRDPKAGGAAAEPFKVTAVGSVAWIAPGDRSSFGADTVIRLAGSDEQLDYYPNDCGCAAVVFTEKSGEIRRVVLHKSLSALFPPLEATPANVSRMYDLAIGLYDLELNIINQLISLPRPKYEASTGLVTNITEGETLLGQLLTDVHSKSDQLDRYYLAFMGTEPENRDRMTKIVWVTSQSDELRRKATRLSDLTEKRQEAIRSYDLWRSVVPDK